jgi:hypothetical protein
MDDNELRRHFSQLDAKITGLHTKITGLQWAAIVLAGFAFLEVVMFESHDWNDVPRWARTAVALLFSMVFAWFVGKGIGWRKED